MFFYYKPNQTKTKNSGKKGNSLETMHKKIKICQASDIKHKRSAEKRAKREGSLPSLLSFIIIVIIIIDENKSDQSHQTPKP